MLPGHAARLIATLTNHTAKAMRYVSVLVDAKGINGAGNSQVSYDFETPLAPYETKHDIVGHEDDGSDQMRLSCEYESGPSRACRDFKRNDYKLPPGAPAIAPIEVSDDSHLGPIDQCWARLVVYADRTGWSVSPM